MCAYNRSENLGNSAGEQQETKEKLSSKPRILLVENDQAAVGMFQMLLADRDYEGYQMESVNTAEGAISKLEGGQHTVVICDLQLDGKKNGHDVIDWLNSKPNSPFVVVTSANGKMTYGGSIRRSNLEEAKATGVSCWMGKPYDVYRLMEEVGCAHERSIARISKKQ